MEEREPLEAEVGTRRERRATIAAVLDAHRGDLAAAEAVVDGELAVEQAVRDAAAAAVESALLATYERCRAASPTRVGVARLLGRTCQGCRLTNPAIGVDALRAAPPGTIAHCDNCGAILVP